MEFGDWRAEGGDAFFLGIAVSPCLRHALGIILAPEVECRLRLAGIEICRRPFHDVDFAFVRPLALTQQPSRRPSTWPHRHLGAHFYISVRPDIGHRLQTSRCDGAARLISRNVQSPVLGVRVVDRVGIGLRLAIAPASIAKVLAPNT